MISVIDKNNGWITLTADMKDRRNYLEKGGIGKDVTKTSILTPSWMQIGYPRNTTDNMKPMVERFGLRQENNRTFLCDK